MEQVAKDRDTINLEAIQLRRDKAMREKELSDYKHKCKEDFTRSLSGISNVSRTFLNKIDSLFPQHIPFQLSCVKQRDNLEQIRNNCTSLSREVEDKFQRYLDAVGTQVSQIQAENSRLKVQNAYQKDDYDWCSKNRSNLIYEHSRNVQKVRLTSDDEKEKLLKEKERLRGEKDVMEKSINYKDGQIKHLEDQIKILNASCTYTRVRGL